VGGMHCKNAQPLSQVNFRIKVIRAFDMKPNLQYIIFNFCRNWRILLEALAQDLFILIMGSILPG